LNRLNPLHLIALLVVIILFMLFKLSQIKDEFKTQEDIYKKSEVIAKELSAYKRVYGDKSRIKHSLNKILSQRSLKSAKLLITQNKNGLFISSKSIDLYALNSLMSKILNGPYSVKSFKINRIDKKHATLNLEIAW